MAPLSAWWFGRSGRWPKEGIRQRQGRQLPPMPSSQPIWIHGASLGEVRVGGFFAEALQRHGQAVIASAMTEPGYWLCREVHREDTACFRLPFDLPGPVGRALSHCRPRALILVETEWWPNLILGAAACDVPVFVINGRVSQRAYRRYRLLSRYWRALLSGVEFFYMRSESDAQRLVSLGVDHRRVAATGLLKVLPSPDASTDPSSIPLVSEHGVPLVWVAGCTRPGEEPTVLSAFRSLQSEFPNLRLWLAPRHPDRFDEVSRLVEQAGYRPLRWSQCQKESPDRTCAPVLIIDQIGILAGLYRHAQVAFVGGSLKPFGGHNPLEPALAGAMVFFGPHMDEQHDAAALVLQAGLAQRVYDAPSLARAVADELRSSRSREQRQAQSDELRDRLLRVRDDVADDLLTRLEALPTRGRQQARGHSAA
ncbi:MAG: glycosyltransferase N-terminal domain-containing protein [Candidatus Zixiibacteriota bacterium]